MLAALVFALMGCALSRPPACLNTEIRPVVEIILTGLENPRGVAVSMTGELYVAEAGTGLHLLDPTKWDGKLTKFTDLNGDRDFEDEAEAGRWFSHFTTYNGFSAYGTGRDEVSGPSDLLLHSDGRLFLSVDDGGLSNSLALHVISPDGRIGLTLADRVAVMKEGELQAYDPPDVLYDKPRTLFVASFVGNPPMNLIDVEVNRENGDYHARAEGIDLIVPTERGEKAAGKGQVIMGIRPEDITIASTGANTGTDRAVSGEIYVVEPLGRDDLIDVRIGEVSIRVLADPDLKLKMGENTTLEFNTSKAQFFDPATEQSLLW